MTPKEVMGEALLRAYERGGVAQSKLAESNGMTRDTVRAGMYAAKRHREGHAKLALATVCSMYAYPQMGEFLRRYDELHPPESVTE